MAKNHLGPDILGFVEFLARERISGLVPNRLEAVRHLPVIADGPLFSVREHIRVNVANRKVVIKILKRSLSPGTTSGPTEEELRRILKEIRILCSKAVFDHDNLIHLESVEFGIHSGDPFEICPAIVLEKAPHSSLDEFLKNKSLTWETKKALCHDIASGLDQLHRHGVLHGDLKPSHVLIFDHPERQYIAKLTGYGDSQIISKMSSADELAFGGTMPFRAPEIEEGSVTFDQAWKTDIFSVGLLFWSIFVNRDFFDSFDLPLDESFRNNDIMDILRLPYLFRFIPLLIEHEIGMIPDQEFQMLQKLFSCTVRLSPRTRDLKQALSILGSKNEETAIIQEGSQNYTIEPVESQFDRITVTVDVLKTLTRPVARQYLKGLVALHQDGDPNTELTKSATLAQFICHLYGCGTTQSPQKATEVLARCLQEEGELADLANLLIPVLHEALSIESEPPESDTTETLQTDADWNGKIGPWTSVGQRPKLRPKDHGLAVGEEDAMLLWSKIQEGDNIATDDCGFSNTLLHAFAVFGQLEQVKHLIEGKHIDINVVNDQGETALLLACRYGNHELAEYLLNHDADASITSRSGECGLHWLCSIPDDNLNHLAFQLVQKGADILDWTAPEVEKDWMAITPGLDFLRDGRINGDAFLRAAANRDGRAVQLIACFLEVVLSIMEPGPHVAVLITKVFEHPLRLACELHLFEIIIILCEEFSRIVQTLPLAAIPPSLQDLFSSVPTDSSAIGAIYLAITDSTFPFRAAIDMSFQVHRLC